MFRTVVSAFLVIVACGISFGEENQAPTVMNLRASQQGDCSNVVDIYYDLFDAENDGCYVYVMASIDGGLTWNLPVAHATGDLTLFDGETKEATRVVPGTEKHIVWEADKDAKNLVTEDLQVKVFAEDGVTTAEMCFVPAGSFKTSTDTIVTLNAFWIDKYEVTNALYCEFLNAGGNEEHFRGQNGGIIAVGAEYFPSPGYENYPARYVTWDDAVAFCDWRSVHEGLPVGSYTLPTEAQWEKAAGWDPRLNRLRTHSPGDSISCDMGNVNYSYCGTGGAVPVGSYSEKTSFYGCYDMTGNVQEWCSDWGESSYPSSSLNPVGPEAGTNRSMRGGYYASTSYYASWNPFDHSERVSVSYRYKALPSTVSGYYGFRCVRTINFK